MSRKIDKIALWLLATLLAAWFFWYAARDIRVALVMTAALALCLRVVASRLDGFFGERLRARKKRLALADAEIASWALLTQDEADARARALLSEDAARVARIPDGEALCARDVLRCLDDTPADFVFVSTAAVSDTARAFAASLPDRRVSLLDRRAAARLIAESAVALRDKQTEIRKKRPVSVLWKRVTARKNAPRQAMYGALMVGMYLIAGAKVYLPAGLALLLLAGIGFSPVRRA